MGDKQGSYEPPDLWATMEMMRKRIDESLEERGALKERLRTAEANIMSMKLQMAEMMASPRAIGDSTEKQREAERCHG